MTSQSQALPGVADARGLAITGRRERCRRGRLARQLQGSAARRAGQPRRSPTTRTCKVAAARVEQAAAYVEAAGSGLYPQVSAIGNVSGKDTQQRRD